MIIIHSAPKRNRRGARGKVKPGYVGKGRIRASGVYWDLLRAAGLTISPKSVPQEGQRSGKRMLFMRNGIPQLGQRHVTRFIITAASSSAYPAYIIGPVGTPYLSPPISSRITPRRAAASAAISPVLKLRRVRFI